MTARGAVSSAGGAPRRGALLAGALAVCAAPLLSGGCADRAGAPESSAAAPEVRAHPRSDSDELELRPVDLAEAGWLSGRVRVEGPLPVRPAPAVRAVAGCEPGPDSASDPACEPVHGVDGGLGGAFVSVTEGWRRWVFPAADRAPVRMEQRGCVFRPRLVAVRAGVPVRISNADGVTHNVHTYPRRNSALNVTQVAGGPELELVFERADIVPVTCDLHPWMKAFVAVAEHPLFACTAADGSYRIEGVPPGAYTVEVWHEVLGKLRQDAVVVPGTEARLDFLYPSNP